MTWRHANRWGETAKCAEWVKDGAVGERPCLCTDPAPDRESPCACVMPRAHIAHHPGLPGRHVYRPTRCTCGHAIEASDG